MSMTDNTHQARPLSTSVNVLKADRLRLSVKTAQETLQWKSGSFEIPLMANKLVTGEHGAAETTKGEMSAALAADISIAYGMITAEAVEQTISRADVKAGNKGFEAAPMAVQMANLLKEL
mgnify:CR=1 FL=1